MDARFTLRGDAATVRIGGTEKNVALGMGLLTIIACETPIHTGCLDPAAGLSAPVVAASCPPPLPPQYERVVSGTVFHASMAPVSNATVSLYLGEADPQESTVCESDTANPRTALTFPDGKYLVELRQAARPRHCLRMTITPRENRGRPYSLHVMDVPFYEPHDPAAATDTLFVNAVLPASGS